MKAVVFHGPGEVYLEERDLPAPGAGEVRLRVVYAGLCSTDRHIVQGHFDVRPPRILGHELTGRVEAVGAGGTGEWIGRDVGVRPAVFCGECGPCRRGEPQLCENFQSLGNTRDGGFAEYTLVPVEQLVPLGELPARKAVWLEPLACVLRAVDAAKPAEGQPVLVSGAGTLGRLMIQVLRAVYSARVAVVDPNPGKVEAALTHGVEIGYTVPRSGPTPEVDQALASWAPQGITSLIDTSGAPAAIERAIAWAGPRGRVVLFGVSDLQARISLSPTQVFSKELTLTAASGMTNDSFAQAEDLLRRGVVNPDQLTVQEVQLEVVSGLLLGQTPQPDGKVLVHPGDGAA